MVWIEWIDRVLSDWNQNQKVAASAMTKAMVVTSSGTWKLSTRLSVISVPTMLINTTASQYGAGT